MQNMTDLNLEADKKIGIFGGAFNPVHNGHLTLAQYYLDSLSLDELYFVPTANPPHRSANEFALAKDRIKMLSLALNGKDRFKISECEFKRQSKSYTYLTVRDFKSKFNGAKFFLIVGADQFLNFDNWVNAEEILDNVTLCTAARNDDNEYKKLQAASESMTIFKNRNIFIARYKAVVISSHQIRDMIKAKEDVSKYLNFDVIEYIEKKGLYNV